MQNEKGYSQLRLKEPVHFNLEQLRDGILIKPNLDPEEELESRETGGPPDFQINNLDCFTPEARSMDRVVKIVETENLNNCKLKPILDNEILNHTWIPLSNYKDIEGYFTNVTDDGGVKKFIIKTGNGKMPPVHAHVWINYDIWMEHLDEPLYTTKRPFKFQFFQPDVMFWLDMGVSAMELKETAYFLIKPEYGFKSGGLLDMIPKDTTLLCKVELVSFVEVIQPGLTQLPDEDIQSFKLREVMAGVNDIKRVAAKSVSMQNWNHAYITYRKATHFLERCILLNEDMETKREIELFKIYNNMAYCALKLGTYDRAIYHCKKALQFREEAHSETAKLFYRLASAEFHLGKTDAALQSIIQAQTINPYNEEINVLSGQVREKLKADEVTQKELFRKMMNC